MSRDHRKFLGIADEQMPAMQRLWDEGLCDLEWTRKDLVHKIAVCHQCPVRALCAQIGRECRRIKARGEYAGRSIDEQWIHEATQEKAA
jgi:hypothetical protein